MEALRIITEEHQNLWRIAITLDQVADEVDAGAKVDPAFFGSIFDYIEQFMDGCHHAKEDSYLFPALRQRTDAYLELVKQAGAEFAHGAILPETARALRQPLFPRAVFEQMADASWGVSREDTAAAKTPEAGRLSPAQAFTRQMAALYDPSTWDGRDRVLEFFYTDTGETCQIVLGKDGQRVLQSDFLPCTTRIETPLSVWQKIGSGELDGKQAMMEHQYRVTGDFSVMLHWDEIFGLGAAAPQPSAEPRKKTNMTLMLLPWMAIWIALSIHAQIGACVGLAVCALLPFAFLKYRLTIFEPCSILAVGTICVLTLLDALPLTLLPPRQALLGVFFAALATLWLARMFKRQIGGYTGDCLGATQQLAEVAFYSGLLCRFS